MKIPNDIYEAFDMDPTGVFTPEGSAIFFDLKPSEEDEAALLEAQRELCRRLQPRGDIQPTSRLHATVLYVGPPHKLWRAISVYSPGVEQDDMISALGPLFSYCLEKSTAKMDLKTAGFSDFANGCAVGVALEENRSLTSFRRKTRSLLENGLQACGINDLREFARSYPIFRHLYETTPHVTLLKSERPIKKVSRFNTLELPKRILFTSSQLHGGAADY